jgi:hypothetical protein
MGFVTKNGVKLSDDMLSEIADMFERGEWPDGKTRILRGRPLMLGEELKSITYKDTVSEIAAMDERAASLAMSRSDYLRHLVRQDLVAH